jgi:HEAT repeat protein
MQNKWTAREIIRRLEEPTENKLPLMSQLRREARIVELVTALSLADDEIIRCNLCDILAWRRAKTAVAVILACLDDPTSDDLKDTAAEALGKIKSPKAGEELLRHFLKEKRTWYAIALGAIGYRPAIPYLIDALASSSGMVRGGAAWSLGEFRAKEALDALETALAKETDSYGQARMTDAIETIKNG